MEQPTVESRDLRFYFAWETKIFFLRRVYATNEEHLLYLSLMCFLFFPNRTHLLNNNVVV